jgi:hypothetical protein
VICGSETHQLFGTATEYDAVSWSTQGDGSFSDYAVLDPVYTPGPSDLEAGGVVLELTVTDGEDGVYNDDLLLTLRHTPETPGMPAGPDLVDLDETVVSEYSCTSAEGMDEYHWSVSPAEAGIIVGAGPEMTMVWDRQFAGTAMISVAGFNDCGEGNYAEALEVLVDNSAVGLNEPVASGWSVSVYPNPASQEVFLRISTGEKLAARIRIISLTGMVLMDEMRAIEWGGAAEAIPVQNLPAGLYLLRVDTQRGSAGTKLVVR